jgi:uncharacterized protein (PEP-CTERM system associated)
LSNGLSQNNRSFRAGLNRQFQRKLVGSLEVRRLQGATGVTTEPFTENAISATLSMTL